MKVSREDKECSSRRQHDEHLWIKLGVAAVYRCTGAGGGGYDPFTQCSKHGTTIVGKSGMDYACPRCPPAR